MSIGSDDITTNNLRIGYASGIGVWGAASSTMKVVLNSTTPSTTTTSGALVVAGGVGIAGALNVGGVITTSFSDVTTGTLTTTAVTAGQIISSVAIATYRSVKYLIQAVDATGTKYHSTEILAVHDGTNVAYTEYASVYTANGICGTFSVDINTGNLRLLVTPSSVNSTVFRAVLTAIDV
jgi:hypothetical protein